MTNSNYKFWKSVSFVLINILVFFIGGIITLISPVADYYRDEPLINKHISKYEIKVDEIFNDMKIADKRLSDVEWRADRLDQQAAGTYSAAWERKLDKEKSEYTPLLKTARENRP